jgi:hypothetical protein
MGFGFGVIAIPGQGDSLRTLWATMINIYFGSTPVWINTESMLSIIGKNYKHLISFRKRMVGLKRNFELNTIELPPAKAPSKGQRGAGRKLERQGPF